MKRVGELGTNVVCSTVRPFPLVNQTTALDSPDLSLFVFPSTDYLCECKGTLASQESLTHP